MKSIRMLVVGITLSALLGGGGVLAQNCPQEYNQVVDCSGQNCGGQVESGHCGYPLSQQVQCVTYGVSCCGGHFLFVESGGPCVEGASPTACLSDPGSLGVQAIILDPAHDLIYAVVMFPHRTSEKVIQPSINHQQSLNHNRMGGGL